MNFFCPKKCCFGTKNVFLGTKNVFLGTKNVFLGTKKIIQQMIFFTCVIGSKTRPNTSLMVSQRDDKHNNSNDKHNNNNDKDNNSNDNSIYVGTSLVE